MYGLLVLFGFCFPPMCPPPKQPPLEVKLEDVHRFAVSPGEAIYHAGLAHKHPDLMREAVTGWNSAERINAWEAECEWRFEAWNLLAEVLDGKRLTETWYDEGPSKWTVEAVFDRSPLSRLRTLDELRRHIGDEAYHAGRMPDPTPKYRPWSD